MRTRDVGFAALGRFLVVERYCQAHEPFSTQATYSSGRDRTGSHADKPHFSSGPRTPAGSRQG